MKRAASANTTWSVAKHPAWDRFEVLYEKGFTVKIFFIVVRGKSRAYLLMHILFGFPDDKEIKGASAKSLKETI